MSLDQWLVRTSENKLTGPHTREQLVQQMLDGKLGLQDEVCQANSYWFFLHEASEVQTHLGVQMPRTASAHQGEEEITETQTEVPPPQKPVTVHAVNRYPGIPQPRPQTIEKPSIWRGFAWALVVAAGVIVYSVLKLLR